MERTLFIVKPDAVERNLIGKILAQVESQGFRVVHARLAHLTRAQAEGFYAEHKERPFFPDLVTYMTSGPVLLLGLEREGAVKKLREVVGATDPLQADHGTVRKLFGIDKQRNSVHASDSAASAERELEFFFSGRPSQGFSES
ncbi:MAG TPA: nucleoside-diphosphate kinase [Candidatus Eisenbacteria bacterium]|nr:nucleoside-diphosphate kinase [Candidatus Eisenbacteria bacterium]